MKPVRLVTFDTFGTLVDWKGYVEAAFPFEGAYGRFLELSAALQAPDAPFRSYTEILRRVAQEFGHGAHEAERFARDMGKALPFPDSGAVLHLKRLVKVGVVSNCDLAHQADVQKGLGTLWDVTSIAEQWGAYKPTAKAWDAIAREVPKLARVAPSEWLHVAAYTDFDLAPAKERGIRIVFLPRPGGSTKEEALQLAPDLIVESVWDLCDAIASYQGAPVIYRVEVTVPSEKIGREFVQWMRAEHGPDLLAIDGCQDYRTTKVDASTYVCEYVFRNAVALDAYLSTHAQELRRRGIERFGDGTLTFKRSGAELCAEQSGGSL